MEELLERKMERVIRPSEEISMISNLASELSEGDETKADKLIHRVLFEMHDRTWGVSLHEGDPDQPLVETGLVCEYLRLASQSSSVRDLEKLSQRAVTLASKNPLAISIYRSMVFELAGERYVEAFEQAFSFDSTLLEPMDDDDLEIYQRVVGKSYWELDQDALKRFFIVYFSHWRIGKIKFGRFENNGASAGYRDLISVFLTKVRVELRRVSRVIVAKKIFAEKTPQRIEIDVKKIRTIQRMSNGIVDFEDESEEGDDFLIDLDTARQFLN